MIKLTDRPAQSGPARLAPFAERALNALPGSNDLAYLTIYTTAVPGDLPWSPRNRGAQYCAKFEVCSEFLLDCRGYIGLQYEAHLRAIAHELLAVAENCKQARVMHECLDAPMPPRPPRQRNPFERKPRKSGGYSIVITRDGRVVGIKQDLAQPAAKEWAETFNRANRETGFRGEALSMKQLPAYLEKLGDIRAWDEDEEEDEE